MESAREKILIIEGDPESRQRLVELVGSAGYQAAAAASDDEGFEAVKNVDVDLLLLDANLSKLDCCEVLSEIKGSAATAAIRVILLSSGGAAERSRGLDMGADDVISRPWDSAELLARIRAHLRDKRAVDALREKTKIAEEGQQIAHTAFEALAVTEKMTRDASSLDRALKIGVAAVLAVAAVMAGTFFLYSHRAQKELQLNSAIIARLEGGMFRQQDLVAQARKLRGQADQAPAAAPPQKAQLQKQAEQLRSQMANADSNQVTELQRQLAETNTRLKRVEQETQNGTTIIQADVSSVCLIHLSVGFRERTSGKRLRFAGLNPQGEPLQDSEGNPIFAVDGRGPEVRIEVFGTGFLAGRGGRVLTNRHVAQPWWKDEEMASLIQQGLQPEVAEINAYFPGAAGAYRASIQEISSTADLAVVSVEMADLKRTVLALDGSNAAALSGRPVVSVGYATGLAAILARADEDTAKDVAARSDGDVDKILSELARRNLIRPLTTQGHIGDVLPDKIVFDAQTTSGGSGGPLFNQDGKVIGVTYAVLSGFGGSNFGIPIRFSEPLLGH